MRSLEMIFREDIVSPDETAFALSDTCESCANALIARQYADATNEQVVQLEKIDAHLSKYWMDDATVTLEIFADTDHIARGCDTCGDDRVCKMFDVIITAE